MRVALVSGPDPGHLIPVAALATKLRAAGHDTLIATSDRWRTALDTDGLGWIALPFIATTDDDTDLGHRLHVRPTHIARPLADALRDYAPDVLVSDTLTRPGALAAAVLTIPWVELIPHPLADPSVALPPFGTGWWPPKPRRDTRARARTAVSVAIGADQQATALHAAGLTATAPAQRLIATFPDLEPPRPDWPDRTTVIGPLSWDPTRTELPLPPGDAPLVLVVGSTASSAGPADLFAAVCAANSTGQWRIVNPRFDAPPAALPPWASAGPGRLAPLLAAARLIVAPGGHGMVGAALAAGVPLVIIPGGGDQKENAARVARAHAGLRLNTTAPRPLRRAIRTVLGDPSYADAARTVARSGQYLPDPVHLIVAAATR